MMDLRKEQTSSWQRGGEIDATRDEGLRQYMLSVYNYMTGGLALTGLCAMAVMNVAPLRALFFTYDGYGVSISILGWVAILAPLGLVMVMSFGINKISAKTAQILFWAYAGLMGVSLANILSFYTGASAARVFFICAAAFAGLSLFGYVTKRSLNAMGSFLIVGLIGLVVAMIVNMFLASSGVSFVISLLGVVIFAGLTAYDTQKIKEMYYQHDESEVASKKAIMGALTLYLDFINLFIMLLRLIGDRR